MSRLSITIHIDGKIKTVSKQNKHCGKRGREGALRRMDRVRLGREYVFGCLGMACVFGRASGGLRREYVFLT